MKRHGQLMAQIADGENLRLAFWKAAKGKRGKADCLAFRERLDENLAALEAELLAGEVFVGDYHYFKVHDPKERLICAAAFRERVLHHAVMNVCEPVLERAAVFDSYACRKGKGRLAAVERASAVLSGVYAVRELRVGGELTAKTGRRGDEAVAGTGSYGRICGG